VVDIALLIAMIIYNRGFASLSENPFIGPNGMTLVVFGAKDFILITRNYQLYRFVLPIVLHSGIIHLLMNLFVQLRYGIYLERKWGTFKLLLLYVISGIGSVILSCLLKPSSISVGASGALAGLLGAHLVFIIVSWNKLEENFRRNTLFQLIFWIVILISSGIGTLYIDFFGHLGGLLVGSLFSLILFGREHNDAYKGKVAQIVGVIALTIYFIVGFVLIFTVIHVQM